ncbi:LPPG:FO 2-phospho-L-lactate transferase [Allocatelliglobosispora scoriae]|uniref:LPPG:FO 2-phospho-L-lactate transferase n=1 Tax=Allocatelliglobosispora scoriae TaxID=643052 RepID=A0A841BRE6_9ACTN|nr:2-phospho-L-lactate transferase [Allocatelliglobosispora scoriae]MBB5870275.1 LPPG:FO 2-phospho-L-lactate transferase [Allocatelliglobosispora scoriae]
MHITVIAGGIGGAKFLQGVRAHARTIGAEVTAIINVGDDVTMHGLRICPDLDSVMYTLGGGNDVERGWGRAKETFVVKEELNAYGMAPEWFGLGDRDIATHLTRTVMLNAGYPLSAVTEALCRRWQPGVRMIPATDERMETHVALRRDEAEAAGVDVSTAPAESEQVVVHFQEWWVRLRGRVDAQRFIFIGADQAKPAPGTLEAIAGADIVLLAPSNPIVSIAPVFAVPGMRDALRSTPAPVVGVSPIIGGSPVRGMADRCLASVGIECSATGVGALYGARATDGLLTGWLVDPVDAQTTVPGVTVRDTPLWMTDDEATASMVRAALSLGGV